MSKEARQLIDRSGGTLEAVRSFRLLVLQLSEQTGLSMGDAERDLIEAIIDTRRSFKPTTAYERILADVANGRPRPKGFDAGGP